MCMVKTYSVQLCNCAIAAEEENLTDVIIMLHFDKELLLLLFHILRSHT